MIDKLARMLRRTVQRDIARRCGTHITLAAWSDGKRNHVLLQGFLVADAGIEALRQHIDQRIIARHFQHDLRIELEEPAGDVRQHAARHDAWNIQPQPTRRPVTDAVQPIERRLDLAQRRGQPIKKTLPRIGQGHAARRAIEKPNAQPGFQTSHRFAER